MSVCVEQLGKQIMCKESVCCRLGRRKSSGHGMKKDAKKKKDRLLIRSHAGSGGRLYQRVLSLRRTRVVKWERTAGGS